MIPVIVVSIYLVIIAVIGSVAYRKTQANTEDFFLANRTVGSMVFFLSLFATNMTAFAILGSSGTGVPPRHRYLRSDGFLLRFGHSPYDLLYRDAALGIRETVWTPDTSGLFSRSMGMQHRWHPHLHAQRSHARSLHDHQHHGWRTRADRY